MSIVSRMIQPVRVEAPSFEEVASAVLTTLQVALVEVVRELPGKNARAVDLQRTLGLDRKLGWQLFTFVVAPQPLSEILSVPGGPSMRRILATASKSHVSRTTVNRAAQAYERFEALVADHGGDRAELVSLISGLVPGSDQHHESKIRKGLFRGLAHVWGMQASQITRTAIIHPSVPATGGEPASHDVLVVVGIHQTAAVAKRSALRDQCDARRKERTAAG